MRGFPTSLYSQGSRGVNGPRRGNKPLPWGADFTGDDPYGRSVAKVPASQSVRVGIAKYNMGEGIVNLMAHNLT